MNFIRHDQIYFLQLRKEPLTHTLKPTSGWEAICLPTSSNAASLTDIAVSQNLPSTDNCTSLSPNTSGSASTMILTCSSY